MSAVIRKKYTAQHTFSICQCRDQKCPVRNTLRSRHIHLNLPTYCPFYFILLYGLHIRSSFFDLYLRLRNSCNGVLRLNPTLQLASHRTLDIQNQEFTENVRRTLSMISVRSSLDSGASVVRLNTECVRWISCLPYVGHLCEKVPAGRVCDLIH